MTDRHSPSNQKFHCGRFDAYQHNGRIALEFMAGGDEEQYVDFKPEEAKAFYEWLAKVLAVETSADIRQLFNKGIGVQLRNKFSFSFETEDEANRAFHYIADLGTLETSQGLNAVEPPPERRETGWLVEDGAGHARPRFRTMDQTGIHWTDDANKALRFARRADAEMFAAGDEDAWRVTQHQWVTVDGDFIHAENGSGEDNA